MKNWKVIESLRQRGVTVKKLAKAISSSYAQVCLTLSNTPGRGYLTRPKLAKLLTAEELKILGWDAEGRILNPESFRGS